MVSVIIPVYNTEQYLERCIQSIIIQTYHDWELVLVDDGSTDQSGVICDFYAEKYENIMVIHNKNQGPAASRACGIERANGMFIMFVDSDDWLDNNILAVLCSEQKKTDANMVCCIFVDIDDKGRKHHISSFKEEYIDCFTAEDCMLHMHRTRYLSGSPCTKLFRKDLFLDIDYCTNVTVGEDYAMIVQIAQKAERVRLLHQELYYRFVRSSSISHSGYSERHRDAFDNYMQIRISLIYKYPNLKADIIGFHTEYEMAVITAMCRNDVYDKTVIQQLKLDLKKNINNTLHSDIIPCYMKGCAFLIAYAHPIFIFLFRILNRVTGR